MPIPVPITEIKNKLLEDGLITEQRFNIYLEEATRKNQNLIDILISENVVDSNYLYQFLASYLNVELFQPNKHVINESIVKSLPENIAREKQIIVFNKEPDGTLDVAMVDPSDLNTIEYL